MSDHQQIQWWHCFWYLHVVSVETCVCSQSLCLKYFKFFCTWITNRACHPGGHYRNYSPGTLSVSQVSASHLNIQAVGARSSNELQWLYLTHRGRVTYIYICVSTLSIIGSDNGLSPCRRQAIIWTNAGILLIWHLVTNCSEILIEIDSFSFKKMHLKMLWRPSCLASKITWAPG